ncbi:MAG: hypothetical protein CL933_25560 [Deltaproteobacteria bacterium]|nr:hypothetical protein [Deltaproteobacteria bacterium]
MVFGWNGDQRRFGSGGFFSLSVERDAVDGLSWCFGVEEGAVGGQLRMGTPCELRGPALKVVLGSMTAQLGLGCMYLSQTLTPAVLAEFGWSRGDFMAAGSPRTFVAALASPIIGMLTHRFGARPVVAVSLFLLGSVYALTSRIDALWHVFALSVCLGVVVAGVGDIAVGTVISKWVHRSRGLALGLVYSGSNLGGLIVSILGAWWLLEYGWRSAYLGVGLGALGLLLPISLWLIRDPPVGFVPSGLESTDSREMVRVDSVEEVAFSDAIRSRDFWVLGIALFFFYFYYIGLTSNLVLFLTDQGISIARASASFGVTVFLGVTSKVGIGLFADRWPAKIALLVNFALVALASFLLLGIPFTGALPLFVVIHGVATAAQNVVYPLVVAERFGTRSMAQIYGALMLALLPGGVLGPIFAGYLFDLQGSYELAFQIFAFLNVLGFAALCSVRGRGGSSALA